MVLLTFPDLKVKEFVKGVTGFEIAKSISSNLAKQALAIYVDNILCDLQDHIEHDATVRIVTSADPEGLEIIRHDAAHILAEAVKNLFPDTQVTIGPVIENGFYYDFARKQPFSQTDLELIQEQMGKIVAQNKPFEKLFWSREKAIEYFNSIGEHYKVEIINAIPQDQRLSIYRQGDFIDLCRGPHARSSNYVKHFKLTKLAGAYWRGDSKNQMLQRIYGTAWATQQQLDSYLNMLEEAAKRDHRKIGKELGLFHLQEEAPGMVFWHDKGYRLWRIIENYIRSKLEQSGYVEVKTPTLVNLKLWEDSGHWEKFGEHMFITEAEKQVMALKPMNCPCHVQIFNQGIKSYKDLPIRMAEFGSCHRYEPSGSLHGIMRVRGFTQDDAHIFCSNEQITDETIKFCKMALDVYKDFGFEQIEIKFSDRPTIRSGSDQVWDDAERALKLAVEAAGLAYTLNQGEGAFYGPKLEFVLKDAVGRQWQVGTIQVDFVLPERLDANYITSQGTKARPVMLHRAILGSFERFIGILIEHYSGRFPLWLAPVQVCIATITNDVDTYAKSVYNVLRQSNIRCDIDISSEKINYKLRRLFNQKIPIIVIIGKQEEMENLITLKHVGAENDQNIQMSVHDLIQFISNKTMMIAQ
jgi:threonyl-tRNA synthetase